MCIIRLRKTKGPPGKGYTLKRMMGGMGRTRKNKSDFTYVGNCHSRLYYLASCQNKEKTIFILPHCEFPNIWEKRFCISHSFA